MRLSYMLKKRRRKGNCVMFRLDFRLKFFLVAVGMIMLAGTIGFAFLENLSFFNSFYFTFITVATVGYGDITPHTVAGKVLEALFW